MPKNIALFIDGTGNRDLGEGIPWNSNVIKLFYAATQNQFQKTHYMQGVGNDSWLIRPISRLFGGAFGFGIGNRIKEAYQFLSRYYDFDDRIYLFGFSRGALAARSLAGFVEAVGLLLRSAAHLEKVEEAYTLYESGKSPAQSELRNFLRRLTSQSTPNAENRTVLPIYFIGVWDTVAALGIPDGSPRSAAKFVARYTRHHQTELPPNVTHARHALALHEIRQPFEPLLWKGMSPNNPRQSLIQVWFPGAHADVGGGYEEKGWSDLALHWMASEAEAYDLNLDRSKLPSRNETCEENIHHEFKGIFGIKPRPAVRRDLVNRRSLASATITTFKVHPSVWRRFLNKKTRQYQFQRTAFQMENGIDINKTLRDADEMSLQLYLDLCFRPRPPFAISPPRGIGAKEWWLNAQVADLVQAKDVIEQFVNDVGVPPHSMCEAFNRFLCLQILCDEAKPLERLCETVQSANTAKLRLLIPRQESIKEFQPWLDRLSAIVTQIDECVALLPPEWQDVVRDAGKVMGEELRRSIEELRQANLRLRRPEKKPLRGPQ
jgi:uncharacterized protein (DUF2235 family)